MLIEGRIVPVFHPDVSSYVSDEILSPWVDLKSGILTTALKFDTLIGLLGLSQTKPMIEAGLTDMTDSLDDVIGLDKIFWRRKGNSEIFIADMAGRPKSKFYKPSAYQMKNSKNATGLGMSFNFATNLDLKDESTRIALNGGAEPRSGMVRVGIVSGKVDLVGYTVIANRVNLNRRSMPARAA